MLRDAIALCVQLSLGISSQASKARFSATEMNEVIWRENENFAEFTGSGFW